MANQCSIAAGLEGNLDAGQGTVFNNLVKAKRHQLRYRGHGVIV